MKNSSQWLCLSKADTMVSIAHSSRNQLCDHKIRIKAGWIFLWSRETGSHGNKMITNVIPEFNEWKPQNCAEKELKDLWMQSIWTALLQWNDCNGTTVNLKWGLGWLPIWCITHDHSDLFADCFTDGTPFQFHWRTLFTLTLFTWFVFFLQRKKFLAKYFTENEVFLGQKVKAETAGNPL